MKLRQHRVCLAGLWDESSIGMHVDRDAAYTGS